MTDLGKMTPFGFSAAEPSAEALIERMGLKGGWSGLAGQGGGADLEQSQSAKEKDDLRRCYAQLFASPAGARVLDDLIEQTLRRSPYYPDMKGEKTLEQQAAHGLMRQGQNGIVCYVLQKIHEGRQLPAPGAKRKKAKK